MDALVEDMVKDFEKKVPENLIRERKLPDGGTVREMGPFVYGYSRKGNKREHSFLFGLIRYRVEEERKGFSLFYLFDLFF